METINPDEILKGAHTGLTEKQIVEPVMELARQTFSDDVAIAKKARQKYTELLQQSIDEVGDFYDYYFLYYCLEKQRRILAEADIEELDRYFKGLGRRFRKLKKEIAKLKT